jgi:hypothetical protein
MTADSCAVAIAGDTQVIEFVQSARERLIFVAPAVNQAVAAAICEQSASLGEAAATVILDTDPEVYRLGYGEPASLQLLEAAADSSHVTLRRQPGLRLCIVIADSRTLIFAPTPQLIEAGPNTGAGAGANAIYLDSPPSALESDLSTNARRPRIGGEPLTAEDTDKVRRDLADNPPQKFDIARRMRVFNSYYEFVDLELTGVQIDRKQVRIPEHLMGVADERTRARLRSHFQLVPEDSKLSGAHLRRDRDLIADTFLHNVPKFGNLVRRVDKPKLEAAVAALRQRVNDFKEKLEQELEKSIERSRAELVKALLPGVSRKPPKQWRFSDGQKPDKETCRRFIERDLARAFGKASQLLSGMEVTLQFKGVTYETLNDEEFRTAVAKAQPPLDVKRLHEEYDAAKATPEKAIRRTNSLFADDED